MIRLFAIILILAYVPSMPLDPSPQSFELMREEMVKSQIIARGISDRNVVRAMRTVPRHLFVPPESVSRSYGDHAMAIGYGQTISQPYIVAYMTELLNLKEGMSVLEIGTGSGYQAAILAEMGCTVYTVEIVEPLADRARELLLSLGYENIFYRTGDGYTGWKEFAPFDAVIVTCAPNSIPKPLEEQLSEGGRMIIPVGGSPFQELVLLKKRKGKMVTEKVAPVMFVPMVDSLGRKYRDPA
jgi:protein-L-isoaspartate(D-aspartate) O-methyltransferase